MQKSKEDIAYRLKSGASSLLMLILAVACFVVFLMLLVGIVRLIFGLAN